MSAMAPPRRSSASSNTSALHADVGTTSSGSAQATFAEAVYYPMHSHVRHTQIGCMENVIMLHFAGVATDGFRIRMDWFRARIKLGGRLALFALAVQFILAFGHIHPDDIYGSLNGPFSTDAVSLATANQGQFLSSDQSTAVTDDFCAICATVSLLGSSVAADAPKLALPEPQTVENATRAPDIIVTPARRPFQSRAPPSA
jgi:hypothetical protein